MKAINTRGVRICARCSIKYKYATSKHSLWLYSKMPHGEVHHLELILELCRTHCLFPELPGTRNPCSERSTSDHVGWCKCLCLLNVLRGCHSLHRCLQNHHLRGCHSLDRRLLNVLRGCHSLHRCLLNHHLRGCHSLHTRLLHVLRGCHTH